MPLDGRPMKIEMASDAKSVINPTRVQQPLMIGRRRGIGAGRITKRGGGRGGQVRRYRGTGVGGNVLTNFYKLFSAAGAGRSLYFLGGAEPIFFTWSRKKNRSRSREK